MTHDSLCVVVIYGADPAQLYDGFALAAWLVRAGFSCQVRRFWEETPAGEAAEEVLQAGRRLVLLVGGASQWERVVRLGRLVRGRRAVVLVGREMADEDLRRRLDPGDALGALVGDPEATAVALARAAQASWPLPEGLRVTGLARPGEPLCPREPLRALDEAPEPDFSFLPDLMARGVPLRASRGYPHPCLPDARRVWEMPIRRRSPERVLDGLQEQHRRGARHVLFTDLCANTDTAWLLDVASGMLARGLELRWWASLWPDPALDAAGVRLLRRSGLRGVDLRLFSGSALSNDQLRTGVDPEAAARLVSDLRREGVRVSVGLEVGFPGEEAEDRLRSMAWLALSKEEITAISALGACDLHAGAPLRPAVRLPPGGGPADWHDGGENNPSKRHVWLRELQTWAARLGLLSGGPFFPADKGQRILGRLEQGVEALVAAHPRWIERALVAAGVLHGREAFCGPEELHLDVPELPEDAALGLLRQAADLGTRRLVLGRPRGDAAAWPGLPAFVEEACAHRLEVVLQVRPDTLAELPDGLQAVRLEAADTGDWAALERWLPALADERAAQALPFPRLELLLWVGQKWPEGALLAARAAELGADSLRVMLCRGDGEALGSEQRRSAREALEGLLSGVLTLPGPDGEPLSLLPRGHGWPEGFRLEQPGCVCPAGARGGTPRPLPGVRGAYRVPFSAKTCLRCPLLAGCPVDRVDFHVPLGLMVFEDPEALLADLGDGDSGLGRADARVQGLACPVGWELCRVDGDGELHACPDAGCESAGNVLSSSLASVWYSRTMNEFRRMSMGSSIAMPLLERRTCARGCRSGGPREGTLRRIQGLTPALRARLQAVGSGDRRGGKDE